MKDYEPRLSFGEDIAETYRDIRRGDEDSAVTFLGRLAGGGPALELAIGAGRLAIPLAAQGIKVDGIDISPAMVDQLRSKPGGDAISVTIGDFADVAVPANYRLIYVVWNSFFNLLTQPEQVRCFENVAHHLTEEGFFVLEAYVPTFLHKFDNNQQVSAEAILVDEVRLDVLSHDIAEQMIDESHVSLSSKGVRLNPVVQRYAWPAELDLMAQIAGLRLTDRWAGWEREPFDSSSELHVSVYARAAT